MHFWIDKRSQGRGQLVPLSLAGYGHNSRFLCSGFHPSLMVTPVHRFQSVESVANSGLRYVRSSGYHSRAPAYCQPTVHYNGTTSSIQNNTRMGRSLEMITTGQIHGTAVHSSTQIAKLKCGVWVFFAIVTFFLAGAKYYFHGVNIGMEAFAFCFLLVIILVIGGLVSLYEAVTAGNVRQRESVAATSVIEQSDESSNQTNQVPNSLIPPGSSELPPPPYHIAIMLPLQNDAENVRSIGDSPPPSYDKAVT